MKIHKIEKIDLTDETAYLAGVIIGDGHISDSNKSKKGKSKDYRICIDLVDKDYLMSVSKMIKLIIKTKSILKPIKRKINRKQRFYFQFRNKSFYHFLTKDLEIPAGRKSRAVRIPRKIRDSSDDIKRYFLAGLFDTDRGFRGKTLGFTTASKYLNEDVSVMLKEPEIAHSIDSWVNKRYKKRYYGIRIHKAKIDKFLNGLPLQNKEKLIRIRNRFNAEVPERSNGTVNSNQDLELVQA